MMASDEMKVQQSRCGLLLRQFLLVVAMIGLEACVTLEVILMIANIQTLGVPIRYSSLPGTVSAALGVVLIPSVGILMDRRAKSKSAKAKILTFTTSFQIVGTFLIFSANMIKLYFYDDGSSNGTTSWTSINTAETMANSSTPDPSSSTYSPVSTSHMGAVWDNATILSTTMEPLTSGANINSTETSITEMPLTEGSIGFYAILAMIGYCLLDLGYDSSNCFLKTFALASTAPKDQSSIIVKSILVSSFGGCLIAVMGSLGLGDVLTAGTSHDSNAAQCALISALCFTLLLTGLTTTLITGFCCPPSSYSSLEDTPDTNAQSTNEKSRLVVSVDASHDLTTSQQRAWRLSHGSSRNFLEKTLSGHSSGRILESSDKPDWNGVIDDAELSPKSGIVAFLIRQKKQIIINVGTFFLLGALYSFEVFAVNFVGDGIFEGDPSAKVGSEEYRRYLKGIEMGSVGTLIYYISFTVLNVFQEIILDRVGWKVEMIVVSALHVVVNLVCALTASLWAFYVTAVWTGIFRTAVVTIPYILANQLVLEQGNGKDSGVAMATVAAMLPLGFTVCSAVMGPLIDVTGNSATPIYYTAVNALFGTIAFAFLKI